MSGRNERVGDLDKTKFTLQRCDPGKGPIEPIEDYQFEGHIISIQDNSTPNWAPYADAGRADPKYMYSQFSRTISIEFLVVSTSQKEHEIFFQKLARLGKMTYPIRSGGRGYNGTHVKYRIDDLISGIGIINSLNYTWGQETPWIYGRPLYTEVSISITNLTDKFGNRPSISVSKYFNERM